MRKRCLKRFQNGAIAGGVQSPVYGFSGLCRPGREAFNVGLRAAQPVLRDK
jgi:hypothetical protein